MKKILALLTTAIFISSSYSLKAQALTLANRTKEKYEKVQVYEPVKSYASIDEIQEESIKDNGKHLNENDINAIMASNKEKEIYEKIVPKTSDEFEVALSYEDGTYEFVDSTNDYEEAVTMANLEKNSKDVLMAKQTVVPAVINNEGQVVYATESVARVWKNYKDGVMRESTSNVYTTSSMNTSYTYIHDAYLSELPIIQQNNSEVKVLVAGYEGWMNTDINRTTGGYSNPNRDIRIWPVTQVTNPCYYTVSNGVLVHYISTSLDGDPSRNSRLTIGKAPSYLKEGKKYLSYDGNYFYEGTPSKEFEALKNIMRDLQDETHNRAINNGNPYYNYYSYLPFRSRTSYSASDLDRFINNNAPYGSKLIGTGQYFINAQNKYGVNAALALGVAINESAWGTSNYAKDRNNLFGLNATDDNTNQNASYFSSPEACINDFAKGWISKGYANPGDWRDYGGFLGNKKFGANVYYASDPYWAEKAVNYAFQLDYELSGSNVNDLKDNDYYQLLLNTSTSSVLNENGSLIYDVYNYVTTRGSHIGAVSAFEKMPVKNMNGQLYYAIDKETPLSTGDYNWSSKGYIPINSVKLINQGKNYFDNEDVNMDTKIDTLDLTNVAKNYNKTSGFNSRIDINKDGIVDIYDLVKISTKI
ncbi:MAG: glucosaminidase domain-containing protein [Clostridium sp.]|uniref:glucosaminidase domain-containing protein n=1 Tax=Clostridium sp. DSM 8431 TaxID=1761781 RepID=UPI0008EEB088|nr:glucosaminidase domain-containing protein [Clostridium sp. DSM 8431]MCR4945086.1 glucosaminidase domain-containing protein [Clostridium sp.]SFU37949.1 Beta-N-acetylglucosaminidase [Clostridium sp. DSM 8431]